MPDEEKKTDGTEDGGGDGGNKQEPQPNPEVENRASLYGWVPKEQFKGDPKKWVSAEKFVERADEVLPISRAMNKRLEGELSKANARIEEMGKTVKAVIQAHKKTADSGYESSMARIKAQQMEAVTAGDTAKWAALEEEKGKLVKPEEIKIDDRGSGTAEHPAVTQWKQDNAWYNSDPELGTYADSVSDFIHKRSPNLGPEEFLQKVKDEVVKRFPERFGNPRRKNPPTVDSGSTGGGDDTSGNGKKTYSDLPADAKAACNETIRQITQAGGKYTKEDYVRDYFGS